MRLVRLGPDLIFYRFLGPKWASLPISGAGAARNGGRFNRPGVEALYLARDVETALAEYRQDASIAPPGTLVAYRLTAAEVVDFSGGYGRALGRRSGRSTPATGSTSLGSRGASRRPGASPTG